MTESASNRERTFAYRDELVLYLQGHGFPTACRAPEPKAACTLSELLSTDVSDIGGTPWTLSVRKRKTIDLSGPLAAAEWKALAQGTELFAAVHHRRAYALSESYVTMQLSPR